MTKAPLLSVASSSKGSLQKESDLLTMRRSGGFDPDVYNLMEELGYDFTKPLSLGQVIKANPYVSNDTEKNDTKIGW